MNKINFHRPGSIVESLGKRGKIISSIIKENEIIYEIEWEDKKISKLKDNFKVIKQKNYL